MNSTEILEGNKLIAEFLNQKLPSNSDFDIYLYHSSWDWLMPVVEKIESLNHPVYINSNNCVIYEKVGRNHGWFIDNYADTKIEATWISCVEFIKITSKKQ